MNRQLCAVVGAIVAAAAFASTAMASPCEGLDCPGVLPATSVAHAPLLQAVAPEEAWTVSNSGFYDLGTKGPSKQRAVAYVAAPGQWKDAPAEIRSLDLHLVPEEMTTKRVIIYSPGFMASGPWGTSAGQATAGIARAPRSATHTTSRGIRAVTAAASDCVYPWFCVWTGGYYSGPKYQWSTGIDVWQSMGNAIGQASSMVNRRAFWTLLKRTGDDRNYCAQPTSVDAQLSNNGFDNNTYEVRNTSYQTQQGWNCAN